MTYETEYAKRKKEAERAVDGVIAELNDVPETLKNSMVYSLSNGGKRVRPVLFFEAYRLFNPEVTKGAELLAVAVECIHTYSLIHDDLPCMDNDDFRRGKPSNHRVFGEAGAVLAGDALLNLAYELCFKAVISSGYNKSYVDAAAKIAKCAGGEGLIAGQSADITLTDDDVSEAAFEYVYRHKTADLMNAALYAGAAAGGAPDAELALIESFAYNFGCAFQLQDDILDYTGNKPKIRSFADIFGLKYAADKVEERIKKAVDSLKKLNRDTAFLETFAHMSIGRKV